MYRCRVYFVTFHPPLYRCPELTLIKWLPVKHVSGAAGPPPGALENASVAGNYLKIIDICM